jgi:16S rRNA G966 N2-methylase RsmD
MYKPAGGAGISYDEIETRGLELCSKPLIKPERLLCNLSGETLDEFDSSLKYFSLPRKSMSKETKDSKEMLPDFPYKSGVSMKDIQLTEEGKYSYTKRKDGDITIDFLHKNIGDLKDLTILDGTGNIGGDTILFGLNFKQVHSIEIDKDNFDALKHNVSLYKLSNVTLHHGDSTKLFDKYESDVVYFDPPWGGPDYKTKKDLDLYLGKHRIDLFIKNDILSEKASYKPKYIVLKLPFNYNWFRLKHIKDIESSSLLKIRNYRILILKVKDYSKETKKEDKKEETEKVVSGLIRGLEHSSKSIVSKLIEEGDTFTLVKKKTRKRSRSRSMKHKD